MSVPVHVLLALILLGPGFALHTASPVDRVALVQREIDDDARLELERQRCLILRHRIRLRSRGEDFEAGIWRFAQDPLDVAEDAVGCGLESARRERSAWSEPGSGAIDH